MKVILSQDVKNLGRKGSVVEVAEGYGRNYLLPHGLAVEASSGNIRTLQSEQDADARKAERELKEAKKLGERLSGLAITVRARAGEGGKLFGSVTNKDVATAIQALAGIRVDRRKIESIDLKSTGSHRVGIKLHPEVAVTVEVTVVAGE